MGIHGYMGCGQGGYGGTGGGDYYEGILTIPRAPFYFTCCVVVSGALFPGGGAFHPGVVWSFAPVVGGSG